MSRELGEEHPIEMDQHVQRPWGRKELGVYENLKDKLDGVVCKEIGVLRRLESGWRPAIHCRSTMSPLIHSQCLSCYMVKLLCSGITKSIRA